MRTAPLSDLVTSQRAGYWGEDAGALDLDVSVIRNGDVHESGEIWWPTVPLRGFRTKEVAKARIDRDDIVITTSADCGRVAHIAVEPPTVTCASNFVRVLRFDASRVSPRYVFHFMHRAQFAASLAPFIRGTAMKNLALADALSHVEVPLPLIPEQIRISGLLDRAEALRAKRRAALAQLDTLTQSIFLDMFGDPAMNPMGWPRVSLSGAVIGKHGIKAGPFGSSLMKRDYTANGYRVYGQEQVLAGRFDTGDYYIGERKYQQLKSCAVQAGDLLVSLVGSFGKVLVVPPGIEPGIINPRLVKITPNHRLLTPRFLAAFLALETIQAELERMSHGGTMGILNAGLLRGVSVVLPPLSSQHEFARRVDAVEDLVGTHRASLLTLDALFASLQQRAFSGRL